MLCIEQRSIRTLVEPGWARRRGKGGGVLFKAGGVGCNFVEENNMYMYAFDTDNGSIQQLRHQLYNRLYHYKDRNFCH